jgi:antitoxin (DNA-binding transcriptional repressor) of toxin-antitoxin stability system
MANVTIRELRNHGGEVVERASHGEQITITRAGKPVASLRALDATALAADVLLARWQRLPAVDPAGLRADIDRILAAEL